MTNNNLDLAITRHLKQAGLATEEQIQEAIRLKDESTTTGSSRSLSDILIEKGILTPVQRDNIEKKLQEQQGGGKSLLHYKLVKKLGEGGMGAVYLADDTVLNRRVAVKVLPKKSGANAEFLNRFKREAEAAAALQHPNVAGAYATGTDQGYHFYVMEYCDGENVDTILKRDRTIEPMKAIDIVLQVARGLECAHGKGFVHRDIKPSNILLTKSGIAKILDLGLTKNLAEGELSFRTVTGVALGTPHYISPEQAMGEKTIDGRADIYSLGASLYHFVTGQPPYEGPSAMEVMSQQVHAQVPNPQELNDDIPESVVHVIRKMMAKKPGDRYKDCSQLISDLEEVALGRSPRTQILDAALSAVAPLRRRSTADSTGRRRAVTVRRATAGRQAGKRSPVPWIAAGAALGVIVLALVFFMGGEDPEPSTNPPVAAAPPPAPAPAPPRVSAPAAAPAQALPKRVPPPTPTREETARQALAEITRFEGLDADDIDGRLALLQKFVEDHSSTFAAAQAQAMMNQLKSPIRRGPVDEDFIKAVSSLAPVDQLHQVIRKLKELNAGYDGAEKHRIEHRSLTGLVLNAKEIRDITPLRALPTLQILELAGTGVTDVSPLKGSGLRRLHLANTGVSDLDPLRGVPLTALNLDRTAVTDLSPLAGLRLRSISMRGTKIRDLSPLKGLPLVDLNCAETGVQDLSPLAGCPLQMIACPFDVDRDANILRSIRTLRRINGQSAGEFWKSHGLQPPDPPQPVAGDPKKPGVAPWKDAVDLMPLIDPEKDAVHGPWKKSWRGLTTDESDFSRLQIPYLPPEEYDFRIVFSRTSGGCVTNQTLWKSGRHFLWNLGDYGNEWSGFSLVRDEDVKENPTGDSNEDMLEDDRLYESVVRVRNDEVSGWLDGKRLARWKTDYSDLSMDSGWALPDGGVLGIGSCENDGMVFHRIEIREISGIGTPLRLGPWRPLFDGASLDFLTKRGEGSWDVRDGLLVKRKGLRQRAAQTVEAFGDGQIRVRFEADRCEFVSLSVRQGGNQSATLALNRSAIDALGSGFHEAVFTCRGDRVGVLIDGQSVALRMRGNPTAGHIQFNASKGTFRIRSIDFRPFP